MMGFVADFAAGGISGAVAKTATAPIERVKLIIQTQDANPLIKSGQVKRYTGIADCFTRVASEQGIKAFWRGNFVNVLRYFPTQAFNFAFKDTIKAMLPKVDKKNVMASLGVNMLSGGLAGTGSLCIVYPLDYARTRLASDVGSGQKSFNGLADCLIKTMRGPSGVMGLYNGFGVSVMGIFPYRGVYFGMYDTLSEMNPLKKDKGPLRLLSIFAIAQATAITAGYASYPMDTVRRRLQMQSEKPQSEWLYKGTMDCFAKVIKDEGTTALFKGAGANALRTVGSALVLVLYGEIKTAMGFEGGVGSE